MHSRFILILSLVLTSNVWAREASPDDIEIVVGEDRTIYEYRQNGVLRIIKVVPKKGRPYYMVPRDGNPNFTGLEHRKKLYPQWVILEW